MFVRIGNTILNTDYIIRVDLDVVTKNQEYKSIYVSMGQESVNDWEVTSGEDSYPAVRWWFIEADWLAYKHLPEAVLDIVKLHAKAHP